MATALRDAVATVLELQQDFLGDKKTPKSPNLCVTDGTKLVAYRFRNRATQQPPSLYYSTKAGITPNRKYEDHLDGAHLQNDAGRKPRDKHGKHLIVASEPSTYHTNDWHLVGRNQVLMADDAGIKIEDIPYDPEMGY